MLILSFKIQVSLMAAEKRSLTDEPQLRRLSTDFAEDCCKISDYNTFEQDEVPDRNKIKNRKIIVITFCIANLFAGTMYSLVAPFYATEVSWNSCLPCLPVHFYLFSLFTLDTLI